MNFSWAIRPTVASCSARTAAPWPGICVRWSQPSRLETLIRSQYSARRFLSSRNLASILTFLDAPPRHKGTKKNEFVSLWLGGSGRLSPHTLALGIPQRFLFDHRLDLHPETFDGQLLPRPGQFQRRVAVGDALAHRIAVAAGSHPADYLALGADRLAAESDD